MASKWASFLAINSCKARAAELQQLTLASAGAKSQMVTCHYCHRSATEFTNICQAVQNTVHTICYRIQAALDTVYSGYSTVLSNKQMTQCVGPALISISLLFRCHLVLLKRITVHTREDLLLCTTHGKVKLDIYKALVSNMVSLTLLLGMRVWPIINDNFALAFPPPAAGNKPQATAGSSYTGTEQAQ